MRSSSRRINRVRRARGARSSRRKQSIKSRRTRRTKRTKRIRRNRRSYKSLRPSIKNKLRGGSTRVSTRVGTPPRVTRPATPPLLMSMERRGDPPPNFEYEECRNALRDRGVEIVGLTEEIEGLKEENEGLKNTISEMKQRQESIRAITETYNR